MEPVGVRKRERHTGRGRGLQERLLVAAPFSPTSRWQSFLRGAREQMMTSPTSTSASAESEERLGRGLCLGYGGEEPRRVGGLDPRQAALNDGEALCICAGGQVQSASEHMQRARSEGSVAKCMPSKAVCLLLLNIYRPLTS